METSIYSIIFACLFSLWCYDIAKKKERDLTAAIIFGFLFELWAVIFYACAKSKTQIEMDRAKKAEKDKKA